MGHRTSFKSGFLLLMTTVVVGCKSSAPKAPQQASSPMPVATATPIAIAQSPTVDPYTPDLPPLANMVPSKTFSIEPPAAFGANEIPREQEVEFQLRGSAGQFLRIEATEAYRISVQAPGAPEPLGNGMDSAKALIYALPQDAIYKIFYAPWGPTRSIKFSWVASDDPAVDPGIQREQLSVDLGAFAKESQLMVIPSVDSRGEEGETWPAHMGIEKHDFEFRIIPIAGYEKFFPKNGELAHLKAALSTNGSKVNVASFPYSLEERWCGYVTSMRRETIAGEGWRGVRWIGGFGGDEDYPSCGLGYVFNGISDDGRYLIVLRADLSHADHKRFMPPRKTMGQPGQTWETSDPKVETEMRQRLEKSLNTADPSSFTPNINDLDAVIRSLKLKP